MYAVVDIETTGNGHKGQKITEISVLVFNGQKIIKEFTSLVNPEQHIPPFITNLTGITNAMVRQAPKFYDIAKTVETLTKDLIFVAHNVNFDYNIIKAEFKQLGFNWSRKKLCTVRLTRKLMPGLSSYSLGNICAAEHIPIHGRHRAKGDAEATAELLRRLILKDTTFVINSFLNPRSKQATLPPLLHKSDVDNLPETPGVYYFKNSTKKIIYIGKAINIKQRVISHFYSKKTKELQLCLETAQVSFTETGSELLALLLESSEIKTHYPKYNTAQKNRTQTIGLFSYEDNSGVLHLAFGKTKGMPKPLSTFNSITACRTFLEDLCKTFNLCPKYCHLQDNVTQCFHYQIKNCKGICIGKESVKNYNKRVLSAIKSLNLASENFVIKQPGRTSNEIGFALILNGSYKGFGFIDSVKDGAIKTVTTYTNYIEPREDNKDVQLILNAFLKKQQNNTDEKKRL